VLSSWEDGYRVPLEDAYLFEDATPERVAALKVEILDDEGKVPLTVWERWFKPAFDRRDKKRAGGVEGNRRRWHADRPPIADRSDTDTESESHPESPSTPSVPSGFSVPPDPQPRSTSDTDSTPDGSRRRLKSSKTVEAFAEYRRSLEPTG
jgi:hypothetical protein